MTESQQLDYRMAVAYMCGAITGVINMRREKQIEERQALAEIEFYVTQFDQKKKEIMK